MCFPINLETILSSKGMDRFFPLSKHPSPSYPTVTLLLILQNGSDVTESRANHSHFCGQVSREGFLRKDKPQILIVLFGLLT